MEGGLVRVSLFLYRYWVMGAKKRAGQMTSPSNISIYI